MVRDTGASYTRTRVPGVTSVTLQQAVAGTYQTEQMSATGIDLTAAAEYELPMAAYVLANTDSKDEVFSWIRYNLYHMDTAQAQICEWFVIRCLITDATQDMDDEATVEALQKDGRILTRGWTTSGQAAYGRFGKISFELHKVKLRYGEEIRVLLLPYYVGAAFAYYGRIEYRQQGK